MNSFLFRFTLAPVILAMWDHIIIILQLCKIPCTTFDTTRHNKYDWFGFTSIYLHDQPNAVDMQCCHSPNVLFFFSLCFAVAFVNSLQRRLRFLLISISFPFFVLFRFCCSIEVRVVQLNHSSLVISHQIILSHAKRFQSLAGANKFKHIFQLFYK